MSSTSWCAAAWTPRSCGRIVADGTPHGLAGQIAGADRVRWRHGEQRFSRSTPQSTDFVRKLFQQHGEEISELAVHRASLEQMYLALVHEAEASR